MNSKRLVALCSPLVFLVSACSSHGQNGALPQTQMEERSAVSALTGSACAIVPSTVGTGFPVGGGAPVGGASATDAWAVGTNLKFEHFDGAAWHSVTSPTIPNQSTYQIIYVDAVTAIAPNDVWVDGQGVGFTNPFQNRTAFFLHWNGTTWTYVPSAPTLTNEYGIAAMAADASNDVWALAVTAASAPAPSVELERWDGSKWSFVASQSDVWGFSDAGLGLEAFAPNDVWMMFPTEVNSIIDHWNGTSLTTTGLPRLDGLQPINGFFAGTSDSDLWYDSKLSNAASTPYIAGHSSSWGPYNTSLVTGYGLDSIVDFRPGYALILATDPSNNPALLVYNGYVRWRPTVSPWPSGSSVTSFPRQVKGTTSFWVAYTVGSTSEVGLVQCPSTPPAP